MLSVSLLRVVELCLSSFILNFRMYRTPKRSPSGGAYVSPSGSSEDVIVEQGHAPSIEALRVPGRRDEVRQIGYAFTPLTESISFTL